MSFSQLPAIQKTTANIAVGTIMSASLAGSYRLWSTSMHHVHPAAFGILNVIAAFPVYRYAHSFTPNGRLNNAQFQLDRVSRYALAKHSFKDETLFFDALHDLYLTYDLPLIRGYNQLIELLPTMESVFTLIKKADADIKQDSLLQEKYDATLIKAKTMFDNISLAIKRIREHKDYLTQLQIYKEFLAHDKDAAIQAQIADAQTQMAHAQKSSTLLKWLKALFGFGR